MAPFQSVHPGGGWNYFGFGVSNGQAAGLVTISNFGVYAP